MSKVPNTDYEKFKISPLNRTSQDNAILNSLFGQNEDKGHIGLCFKNGGEGFFDFELSEMGGSALFQVFITQAFARALIKGEPLNNDFIVLDKENRKTDSALKTILAQKRPTADVVTCIVFDFKIRGTAQVRGAIIKSNDEKSDITVYVNEKLLEKDNSKQA